VEPPNTPISDQFNNLGILRTDQDIEVLLDELVHQDDLLAQLLDCFGQLPLTRKQLKERVDTACIPLFALGAVLLLLRCCLLPAKKMTMMMLIMMRPNL
jgi:hypothetical protein